MISYELSLGLAVIPIFMIVGHLRLSEVVDYQIKNGWMIAPFTRLGLNFHLKRLMSPVNPVFKTRFGHFVTPGISPACAICRPRAANMAMPIAIWKWKRRSWR